MGLDMCAISVPSEAYDSEVDFHVKEIIGQTEIHAWRKHNALHGWMFNLYKSKGGVEEEDGFNCVNLNLTVEDLSNLKSDVNKDLLPETSGFFFGLDSRYDATLKTDCISFIEDAMEEIGRGKKVFYTSWW